MNFVEKVGAFVEVCYERSQHLWFELEIVKRDISQFWQADNWINFYLSRNSFWGFDDHTL